MLARLHHAASKAASCAGRTGRLGGVLCQNGHVYTHANTHARFRQTRQGIQLTPPIQALFKSEQSHKRLDRLDQQSRITGPASTDADGGGGDDDDYLLDRSRFLARVYTTSGTGLTLTFAASYLACTSGLAATHPLSLVLGGGAVGLGAITAMGSYGAEFKMNKSNKAVAAVYPAQRWAAFAALSAAMGVSMAPVIGMYSATQPYIIPAAAFTAFLTMGGASMYALKAQNKLLTWQPALSGSLCGILGISLAGIGLQLTGFSGAASVLMNINTYGGIVLFAGMTAYDTSLALDMHARGKPDHLEAATTLLLDFCNLFVRIMKALSQLQQNKN